MKENWMGNVDSWQYEHENIGGQGEGHLTRAMLDREQAEAVVRYRRTASEATGERAEYWTNLADCLQFGAVRAEEMAKERAAHEH